MSNETRSYPLTFHILNDLLEITLTPLIKKMKAGLSSFLRVTGCWLVVDGLNLLLGDDMTLLENNGLTDVSVSSSGEEPAFIWEI